MSAFGTTNQAHALDITPISLWHTPECVRLTKTSPTPGLGVSISSIFVEILPGLSYTKALCLDGTWTEAMLMTIQTVCSRAKSMVRRTGKVQARQDSAEQGGKCQSRSSWGIDILFNERVWRRGNSRESPPIIRLGRRHLRGIVWRKENSTSLYARRRFFSGLSSQPFMSNHHCSNEPT